MKRKQLIKRLRKLGFTFAEAANHTKVYDSSGVWKSIIKRHTEIPEEEAKAIMKQLGIKL